MTAEVGPARTLVFGAVADADEHVAPTAVVFTLHVAAEAA
jgi:hypothetical protein